MKCFLIYILYEGFLFISAIQGGVRISIWLQVSLNSKVFPTGSRLRPPPPCPLDTWVLNQACCILMASSTSSLCSSLRLHGIFLFSSVGDLESDISNAWPLSVSITLWVFIGYQFCILHLFEDLSGRAWHLFLLCVCRAWLPSYLRGDPVRTGVWKGETVETS